MNKTVVIHQPDFLPYIGFFHRLLHSNLFVILDNVQFQSKGRNSWQNRDKIKTPQGEKWLTVSVAKSSKSVKINEVLLSGVVDWRANNIEMIVQNYRKASFFDEIFPYVDDLYKFQCKRLVDFSVYSIDLLLELFDIKIEKVYSSDLSIEGSKDGLLINILKSVDADCYLSGMGAKDYISENLFDEAKIRLIWQNFNHPVYHQPYGEFIPNLSSIDLFFNCGIEKARKILRNI